MSAGLLAEWPVVWPTSRRADNQEAKKFIQVRDSPQLETRCMAGTSIFPKRSKDQPGIHWNTRVTLDYAEA